MINLNSAVNLNIEAAEVVQLPVAIQLAWMAANTVQNPIDSSTEAVRRAAAIYCEENACELESMDILDDAADLLVAHILYFKN